MTGSLHLTVTTPATVLVDRNDVVSVRAEDESGGFGILPGHADFLTVLPASVVRWRAGDGIEHYCVLNGGIFSVTGGARVAIACRQGTIGDDLPSLEADVARMHADETDADKRARVEQMRLHAHAVRQIMRFLRPAAGAQQAEAAMQEPGGDMS